MGSSARDSDYRSPGRGWLEANDFGSLKALPSDGKPVTKWSNQDSAWADVTNGIREAIMDLRKGKRRRH
jgi:hypothetical protein